MKKITIFFSAIIVAVFVTTGVSVAARGSTTPKQTFVTALNHSIGKKWVSSTGTIVQSYPNHGKETLTYKGVGTTFGGVGADLKGGFSMNSKTASLAFGYHVVLWAGRGADKIGPATWQCMAKGTQAGVGDEVRPALALLKRKAKTATVTSSGTAPIRGHVDDVLAVTATERITADLFPVTSGKSITETVKALVTVWVNPKKSLIEKVKGRLVPKKVTKTHQPTTFKASFSHYGDQVAITMPKVCP